MSYFDENVIPGAQIAGQYTQQTTIYGSATAADEQTAIDLAKSSALESAYTKFGISSGITVDNTTDSIRIQQNTIFDNKGNETYTYTVTYGATAYVTTPVTDTVTKEEDRIADDATYPPDYVPPGPSPTTDPAPYIPDDATYPPDYVPPVPDKPVVTNPVVTNPVVVTGSTSTTQQSLVNPLHEYDSYTYCLSWHLMNIFDFNEVVDDPQHRYIPRNVLISSAGRFQNYARSPAFTEDFYFDNLKMSTIIGAGKRNKSSNVVECNFTIIEPIGFTLFNRLVAAAEQVNGKNGNYIKMPYMLQIDFFGIKNGELGESPIPGLTKHIPITLIGIKSRVSARGTEYSVNAVAFNHSAFNQTYVRSPADFTIKASKVSEVFGTGQVDAGSTSAASSAAEKEELQRQESDLEKQIQQTSGQEAAELRAQANSLKSKIASYGAFNINGFTDGCNAWYQDLKRRGTISKVHTVRVEFDPEIGLSDIYPADSPVSTSAVASADNNTTKDEKSNIQANLSNKGKIQFNAGVMTIPAGTSITDLIDWAVRNSKWMEKQLYDPTADSDKKSETASQLKDPLKWVKIIPKVKFSRDGYDPSTNLYTLDITYYVKPWRVNSKLPTGPLGKTPGYVKEYNYIYTGQNRDVIDLQIDFDMLYYQQMTANRNKRKTTMTAPVAGDPEVFYENNGEASSTTGPVSDVQKSGPIVVPKSKVQPVPVAYTANDIRFLNRSGGNQAASVTGADLQKNLFKGDMISVKLKILGDPHFIKQDDIFFGQDAITQPGLLTNNGSLWMDNSELYVYVKFQSPRDYDESTGLAVVSDYSYTESDLSGVYRVISVDNEFARGQFVQTLDLARLPLTKEMEMMTTNALQRNDSALIVQLSQQGAFTASRFTGPAILQSALKNPAGTAASLALTAATNPQAATGIAGSLAQSAINSAISNVQKISSDAVKEFAKPALESTKEFATSIFDDVKTNLGFAEADFAAGNYGRAFTDVTGIDVSGFGFNDGIAVDPNVADAELQKLVGDVEVTDVALGDIGDLGDFFG